MENNNYENPTPTLPLDAQLPEEPKKPNNKKLFLIQQESKGFFILLP